MHKIRFFLFCLYIWGILSLLYVGMVFCERFLPAIPQEEWLLDTCRWAAMTLITVLGVCNAFWNMHKPNNMSYQEVRMFSRWKRIAIHLSYYILMYLAAKIDETPYIVYVSLFNMAAYLVMCMRIEASKAGIMNRTIERVSIQINKDLFSMTYKDFCKKYGVDSEDEDSK